MSARVRHALAALIVVAVTAGCTVGGRPATDASPPGPGPATAPAGTPVTFPAPGSASLSGRLFGTGSTAVVLSTMSDNDPTAWERYAPALAAKGYAVLTYAYRYPRDSRSLTARMARDALADLRGAVAFVRGRGARRIVLVGASLGGMTTAKLAGELRADAVVVLAAPADRPDFDFRVEPGELAAVTVPKLFLASEDDSNVDPSETRRLYDLSPEPRRWHTFPGAAHGTQLFATAAGEELARVLTDFIATAVPTDDRDRSPASLRGTPQS
jgi:pimeloyl-ACP methyl ester carboxylesterase